MAKKLYELLGITDEKVDAKKIASAFRGLAKIWHPDRNPGNTEEAAEKFKQIKQAYDLLSDTGLRSQYDKGEIDEDGQVIFSDAPATAARSSSPKPSSGFFGRRPTISPVNFNEKEFRNLFEQTSQHDRSGVDAFCEQIRQQPPGQWRLVTRKNFLNFVHQLDVATRLSWAELLKTIAVTIENERPKIFRNERGYRDVENTQTALDGIMHISRSSQSGLDASDVESTDAFCQRVATLGHVDLKNAITGFMKELLEMPIDERVAKSESLQRKAYHLEECASQKIKIDLNRYLITSRVRDMLEISQRCKSELGNSPDTEECDAFCQKTVTLATQGEWLIQYKNFVQKAQKMTPEQLIEKRDSLIIKAHYLEKRIKDNPEWIRVFKNSGFEFTVPQLLADNDSAPKPAAM